MPHYPNPFDFVPFPPMPILNTEKQFDALGKKLSGYLELEIKALTPVHVVGRVKGSQAEHQSFFFRQNDQPCIPASSIRGCLRAFIEALTAGWVSQWTQEYNKIYGRAPGKRNEGRHIGFCTFEDSKSDRPAINHAFKPNTSEGKLDVASYLFGIVAEGKQIGEEEQARKSKLWVEDAYLDLKSINVNDCWMPDIAGNAFMGGAKPSASNWWYFQPAEIWKRNLPSTAPVAEFVGEHFRGRKFYYHQDPMACIQKYHPDSKIWDYPANGFHTVRLECMCQDAVTQPFRIYLDAVPHPLFQLLLRVLLLPGGHIRHKLGYAKAYGYGSIEFVLRSARLRKDWLGIPMELKTLAPQGIVPMKNLNWSDEALKNDGLTSFVDRDALHWLTQILGWPHQGLLFMYPQYRAHEFKQPIPYSQFELKMKTAQIKIPTSAPVMIKSKKQARDIAEALWDIKRPIDFRLYQERAEGWNTIVQREP
jgi:hypothetical protein